jgi:anthranilate synthase component 2
MLVMIDNYDSFTYNLVQYFGELYKGEIRVFRNDTIDVSAIERLSPQYIVVSPGPCTPKEAGISVEVIQKLGPRIPLLGVCLGHQGIGFAFGGNVIRAPSIIRQPEFMMAFPIRSPPPVTIA